MALRENVKHPRTYFNDFRVTSASYFDWISGERVLENELSKLNEPDRLS